MSSSIGTKPPAPKPVVRERVRLAQERAKRTPPTPEQVRVPETRDGQRLLLKGVADRVAELNLQLKSMKREPEADSAGAHRVAVEIRELAETLGVFEQSLGRFRYANPAEGEVAESIQCAKATFEDAGKALVRNAGVLEKWVLDPYGKEPTEFHRGLNAAINLLNVAWGEVDRAHDLTPKREFPYKSDPDRFGHGP